MDFDQRLLGMGQDMSRVSPGPWKVYSAPLRPNFPTLVIEVQDVNDEPIVKWTGFDGADQPKRQKLANARLMAGAWELLKTGKELDHAIGGDGDELLKVVAKWRSLVKRLEREYVNCFSTKEKL